jgi:predicted transcriptional regulator
MSSSQDKIKELVWKEEEFITEVVDKLKQIMRIDEKGNPYFLIQYDKLKDIDKLGLHLITRFLAERLKVTKSNLISIKELSRISGVKYDVAVARLKDMLDKGLVQKEESDGVQYGILPHGINVVIESVLEWKRKLSKS